MTDSSIAARLRDLARTDAIVADGAAGALLRQAAAKLDHANRSSGWVDPAADLDAPVPSASDARLMVDQVTVAWLAIEPLPGVGRVAAIDLDLWSSEGESAPVLLRLIGSPDGMRGIAKMLNQGMHRAARIGRDIAPDWERKHGGGL